MDESRLRRRQPGRLTDLLVRHGAERGTATLAAEIGMACYHTGRTAAGIDPRRLPSAVDTAFARLSSLRP